MVGSLVFLFVLIFIMPHTETYLRTNLVQIIQRQDNDAIRPQWSTSCRDSR